MDEKKLISEIEFLKKEISTIKEKRNFKGLLKNSLSKINIFVGVGLAFFLTSMILWAAQITFSDGTIISADEVNNNFNELYTIVGNSNKVVFTRWGVSSCPTGTSLVYTGYIGSSRYDHSGGGSNQLCLSGIPTWNSYSEGNENGGLLYGTEYMTSSYGISDFITLHNYEASCAVCLADNASNQIMYPGSQVCPDGWTLQYAGYLMSTHYSQSRSEFICIDEESNSSGSSNNDLGNLLYPVEAECGSLPCPPYIQNREVTCSVCTR